MKSKPTSSNPFAFGSHSWLSPLVNALNAVTALCCIIDKYLEQRNNVLFETFVHIDEGWRYLEIVIKFVVIHLVPWLVLSEGLGIWLEMDTFDLHRLIC